MAGAKKLKHFSHKHALTLVEMTEEEAGNVEEDQPFLRCFGCTEKITNGVPYYLCEQGVDCPFFCLHQACADMPMTIEDSTYQDPNCAGVMELKKYQSNLAVCCACERSCYRFAYACSECPVKLCMRCAVNKDGEAKMSFHQHPVCKMIALLPAADQRPCSACSLSITGGGEDVNYYGCNYCDFIVHPDCTNVPLVVQSPSHDHPLELCSFTDSVTCQVCIQVIDHTKDWCYSCNECSYYTHIYDYSISSRFDQVQHNSHEHELLLIQENDEEGTGAFNSTYHSTAKECHGCKQNISWGPYFMCAHCETYYLHVICAEIPEQIEHPMHPGCTLDWYQDLQFLSPRDRICGLCHIECSGFAYYCSSCKFALDIVCALKAIKYCDKEFHPQHPLVLSLGKGSLNCHACDGDDEGISYQCNTCQFWVHERCALITTLKEAYSYEHEHTLHLIYSIPDKLTGIPCQVCGGRMNPHNWAFHCYKCRYFTHISDCRRDEVTIDTTITVINLPLPDVLILDKKAINGATLKPHCNPMILFEDQFESNVIDLSPSVMNLVQSSSTWPTYHVDGKDYNGFTFTFYNGKLAVDVTSVDLPQYIKHEAHPAHVLKRTISKTWCNACEHSFFGHGYSCTACAFSIHTYCALLPGKIKHRYDKHPFPLMYSAVEGIEEYVCEICEGDVIPKWFYHCVDCDQSIHARCIWKAYTKFEGFFRFHLHKCNLALVPASNDLPKCIICGTRETFGHGFAFLCTKHEFMVHLTCTYEDEVEVSLEPSGVEELSE